MDAECEVLVDVAGGGQEWRFGMIAEWRHAADGTWTAFVRYSAPDGNRLDTFPASLLRSPEIDWSRGRKP